MSIRAARRQDVIDGVKACAVEHRDTPFTLAGGQLSHDYVDVKRYLARGQALRQVSIAMVEYAFDKGIKDFTAVGGLTMGADSVAHGISVVWPGIDWFTVRKELKERGHNQLIEGKQLAKGDTVLLTDDVITMGGSVLKAYNQVITTGAEVVGVMPVVDRGIAGQILFEELGVLYVPLMNYVDLGIEPVVANNR